MSAILLVHDDHAVIERLSTGLAALGHTVTVVSTAFAARSKLERGEFAAVLAGLEAAGGSGYSLLAWARDERNALLGSIAVLAETDGDRLAAASCGVAAIATDDVAATAAWIRNLSARPSAPRQFDVDDESPTRILVVDNDKQRAAWLIDTLRQYDFEVTHCETSQSARETIASAQGSRAVDVLVCRWSDGQAGSAMLYDWLVAHTQALAERCLLIAPNSTRKIRERAPRAICLVEPSDPRLLVAAVVRAARHI